MQTSKICKKNHNSCPVFPIRTRKTPLNAFANHQGKWQAYSQTQEQAQARSLALYQVQKIAHISELSVGFWEDVSVASFVSMEEVMEAQYDLSEEFYKEALVLKKAVKAFLHAL